MLIAQRLVDGLEPQPKRSTTTMVQRTLQISDHLSFPKITDPFRGNCNFWGEYPLVLHSRL